MRMRTCSTILSLAAGTDLILRRLNNPPHILCSEVKMLQVGLLPPVLPPRRITDYSPNSCQTQSCKIITGLKHRETSPAAVCLQLNCPLHISNDLRSPAAAAAGD